MTATTTQRADEIRRELRAEHGLTSRDVSVRTSLYSMGSSIRVQIKTARGFEARESISEIAERHEHIHRCEYSGDILGGGNIYVNVSYSAEVEEIIGRRHMDAVREAMALCEEDRAAHPGQRGWLMAPIASAPWARLARESVSDWMLHSEDACGLAIWADHRSHRSLAWAVAQAEPEPCREAFRDADPEQDAGEQAQAADRMDNSEGGAS